MKTCLVIYFLVSGIVVAHAESEAARIETIRTKRGLPALGALWITGAQTNGVMTGVRKLGDRTPARVTDRFHLGSCTKAMTATLVAIAVDQKKLKWESTLPELFPELATQMRPEFRKVTLAMLTSQRSGLTGDLVAFEGGGLWRGLWEEKLDPVEGRKRVAKALLLAAPALPPGATYVYSNANYILAGAALENAYGQSWEKIARAHLFAPLGMSSCGFGPPGRASAVSPDEPWAHEEKEGALAPIPPGARADNPATLGPAGSVHCSLGDWGKFIRLHLQGASGQKTKVLSAAGFAMLHAAVPGQSYTTGGWNRVTRAWAGGEVFSHTGSNTVNYANVWWAPRTAQAFLVVTNAGSDAAFEATDEVVGFLVEKASLAKKP